MKNLSIIIIAILCLGVVQAQETVDYYDIEPIGKSIQGGADDSKVSALDEDIDDLQVLNAEMDSQLATRETVFEIKKQALLDQADEGWDLVIALLKLIMDSFVLLMYVVEMRILLYLIIELIPSVFIRIRDSLVNWGLERGR